MNIIAWETTRKCPLKCKHCRGGAENIEYENELSTSEGKRLITQIAQKIQSPMIIFTGGEPMFREDIWELASYAHELGVHCVMSPCGSLITAESAKKMYDSYIRTISISLDGPDSSVHDQFRGIEGTFERSIRGISFAQEAGIQVQINCTISKNNVHLIDDMLQLTSKLHAIALDLFFLVPTGRGKSLAKMALSAVETENALLHVKTLLAHSSIPIRVTCAPQWRRILGEGAKVRARGCLAGKGFIFVSHIGIVQPCGFLNLPCGNLRENDFDLAKILETSEHLNAIKAVESYHGKCGTCRFSTTCGGCRARAYEVTGDYLAEEPGCLYHGKDIIDE